MGNWPMMPIMMLGMVAFWGFVAWVVVTLVRGHSGTPNVHDAEATLAERFARGEITPDEYAERREVLAVRRRRPASSRTLVVVLAGVALVSIVLAAVIGWAGDSGPGRMRGPMMGGTESSGSAPAPEPGAPEVRVVGTDFAFSPDEVRSEVGETVNLVLDNRGDASHTFTVSELDFELTADPGDRAEGSLTVDSPGTYEVVCTVPGHAEAGMRGQLVVESAAQRSAPPASTRPTS